MVREYEANNGKEFYISYETINEDIIGYKVLFGFLRLRINNSDEKVRLGELTTANLRLINHSFDHAKNNVPQDYPTEHLADIGLQIDDDKFIEPGETHKMFVLAKDARWETERLTAFLTDVDARIGALLFFYNELGERKIVDVASSILPVFTDDDGLSPDYQRIGR